MFGSLNLGLGLGAGGAGGGGFDLTFGGALSLVRDHNAEYATDADGTLRLPNSLGAGYPREYSQATAARKPTIGSTNGVQWLESDNSVVSANVQFLKTSANYEVNDTDIFVLYRRTTTDNSFFLGHDGANARFGFIGTFLRAVSIPTASVNVDNVPTGTGVWRIGHLRLRTGAASFVKVIAMDGTEISVLTMPGGLTSTLNMDMIMAGYLSGSYICGSVRLRRVIAYAHGAIPTTDHVAAIVEELAVDGNTLNGV